jgi:hypothetical protein
MVAVVSTLRRQAHFLALTARMRVKAMASMRWTKFLLCCAAFISFLASVGLWFAGHRDQGLFVGLWVPSILSLGSLLLAGKRESA